MALSRRGFLFALGLAVPATAMLSEQADATTSNASSTRRKKPAGQGQTHAGATTKPKKTSRQGKAHASNTRRRRPATT